MEENENKQQEEQSLQSSREEILALSRKENKHGDEREMQTYNKALQLGYGVGFICLSLVMIVNIIVDDVLPLEMWICFTAYMATMGLYYGIKTNTKKKALFLTEGIFGVACFIFFLVAWILKLCGVWLF